MLRMDILELSYDALVALSNLGFVKRATKDVAEGKIPDINLEDDNTIIGHFDDGHVVKLPIGKSLKDTLCTCPASSMCRHRVTVVLAYQSQNKQLDEIGHSNTNIEPEVCWSFKSLSTQVEDFSNTIIKKAQKIVNAGITVTLNNGKGTRDIPTAQLPMCSVSFFSQTQIAHARCDCITTHYCEHILIALWAFSKALEENENFTTGIIELKDDKNDKDQLSSVLDSNNGIELVNLISNLTETLWLEGTTQSIALASNMIAKSLIYSEKISTKWITDSLLELKQMLVDQENRSTRYDAVKMLGLITNLCARIQAAKYMDNNTTNNKMLIASSTQILGVGIKGEVAISYVKLIPLGAQYWINDKIERIELIYIDPTTETIMMIEREWNRNPEIPQSSDVFKRRISNIIIKQLIGNHIITNSAKRRANGILTISSNKQSLSLFALRDDAWDQIKFPVKQTSIQALKSYLSSKPPEFIAPKQLLNQIFILPITQVSDWTYDHSTQIFEAKILTATSEVNELDIIDEEWFILKFSYNHSIKDAFEAFVHVLLSDEYNKKYVSGIVTRKLETIYLEPLALLTDKGLHSTVYSEKVLSQNLSINDLNTPKSALELLLDKAESTLATWLKLGLRHQGMLLNKQLNEITEALHEYGLDRLSMLFKSIINCMGIDSRDKLAFETMKATLLINEIRNLRKSEIDSI